MHDCVNLDSCDEFTNIYYPVGKPDCFEGKETTYQLHNLPCIVPGLFLHEWVLFDNLSDQKGKSLIYLFSAKCPYIYS